MEFKNQIGGYDVFRNGIIAEINTEGTTRFYPLELVGGYTIKELEEIVSFMKSAQ
mgnify:CR=1 FL=1